MVGSCHFLCRGDNASRDIGPTQDIGRTITRRTGEEVRATRNLKRGNSRRVVNATNWDNGGCGESNGSGREWGRGDRRRNSGGSNDSCGHLGTKVGGRILQGSCLLVGYDLRALDKSAATDELTQGLGLVVNESNGGTSKDGLGNLESRVASEGCGVGGKENGDGSVDLRDDTGSKGQADCGGSTTNQHLAVEELKRV
jgi:hypothetical protein